MSLCSSNRMYGGKSDLYARNHRSLLLLLVLLVLFRQVKRSPVEYRESPPYAGVDAHLVSKYMIYRTRAKLMTNLSIAA